MEDVVAKLDESLVQYLGWSRDCKAALMGVLDEASQDRRTGWSMVAEKGARSALTSTLDLQKSFLARTACLLHASYRCVAL